MNDAMLVRKLALIEEGRACRAGVQRARHQLGAALQPDALAHGAAGYALGALRTRLDQLFHPLDVKALAPYALGLVGLLRRRAPRRALLAAAGAAALGWCWSRFAGAP
ncbi:MAG: hypothetical protein V4463_11930 [Pseudomonadota bacterium]